MRVTDAGPRFGRPQPLNGSAAPVADGDPALAARRARLRYVSDSLPGIRRVARGKGFAYREPGGGPVRDPAVLRRIRSLAIPPAWSEVWICPHADGHIQASGRDARGRKQYRYHPDWRAVRDATKFGRSLAFGLALPRIRRHVEAALGLRRHGRERVLAAVLRLLDVTFIRIGNEEYARHNRSFGLTTLRDEHVSIEGGTIRFEFRGKSGRVHRMRLSDRRLARIVKSCQDVPGQILFQYLDEAGCPRSVDSADVNAYLRTLGGSDFTAKDFRTWAASVLALQALARLGPAPSRAAAQRNLNAAIAEVATRLGNSRTICRKCYVHPALIAAYLAGRLGPEAAQPVGRPAVALSPEEQAFIAFLRSEGGRRPDAAIGAGRGRKGNRLGHSPVS